MAGFSQNIPLPRIKLEEVHLEELAKFDPFFNSVPGSNACVRPNGYLGLPSSALEPGAELEMASNCYFLLKCVLFPQVPCEGGTLLPAAKGWSHCRTGSHGVLKFDARSSVYYIEIFF